MTLPKFYRIKEGNIPNPIISASTWDSGGIREIGNIIYDSITGKFLVTYTGISSTNTYIGLATSSDLITWTKEYGPGGDGQLLTDLTEDPYLIKNGSTYYLYVEDKTGGIQANISLYTSTDLITWTEEGTSVLEEDTGWEADDVSSPVVWIEGSTWYMLYEGRGPSQTGQIGLATSTDGITWVKDSSNPVCTETVFGSINCIPDDIIKIDGVYYIIVHGQLTAPNGVANWRSFIASSTDLHNWTDYLGTYIDKPFTTNPQGDVHITKSSNNYILVYSLDDPGNIYIAIHEITQHVVVGTGTAGTRFVDKDYPNTRGLTAGTTIHLIDKVDFDDEA